MEKICKFCGETFITNPKGGKRKYCSGNCKSKDFYKNNTEKRKLSQKKYVLNNPEKRKETVIKFKNNNPEKIKEYQKKYDLKRRKLPKRIEYNKNYNKKYREENKEQLLIKHKERVKKNKEKYNQSKYKYRRNKYATNPAYRMISSLRCITSKMFKNSNYYKTESSVNYIGCDNKKLVKHFEDKFISGMSWANHGSLWDIDHIIPISLQKSKEDVITLSNYKNLEPKLKSDNLRKGNKMFQSDIDKIKEVPELYNFYLKIKDKVKIIV